MQGRYLKACGVILSVCLLCACAGSKSRLKLGKKAGGEVVEAEGMVPYKADDLPGTKAGSLAAAQRSAVEKVVGVFISGETKVKKAVTIDQKILARTQGYIKQYDILAEAEKDGYYFTKIRAYVSFDQVFEDLAANELLDVAEIGNPRVAVLIDESVDGEPADTTHAADSVSAALIDSGYTIVERSALAGAVMQRILSAVEAGNPKAVMDLGSKVNAEVVLLGEGDASRIDPHPKFAGFISYRARVAVKAVRSGTGQILASIEKVASGMDITETASISKAFKETGQLLGEELGEKMAQVLRDRSEIGLTVNQVADLDQLEAVQKALRSMSVIDGVFLRNFSKGTAELSLRAGPKAYQEISEKLGALSAPKLRIQDSSPSRIVVQVASQP